ERVGHVVAASLEPLRQTSSLKRGPSDDRGAAADLGVVLLNLTRALPGDRATEDGLAQRAARKLDDLPVGEEPREERTHRAQGIRTAEIEEEDSGLQTVREKTCFSPS